MDINKNKKLTKGVLSKLKIFFSPFYNNGSSYTMEEAYVPQVYKPIYEKKK